MKRTTFYRSVLPGGIAILLALFGCNREDNNGENANQNTSSTNTFKFVIISDVHVRLPGNPDNAFYDNARNIALFSAALNRINAEHPDTDFVVVNGDMTGCLFSDNPADYGSGVPNPAETFKIMMDSIGTPYYAALGNHDYENGFNTTNGQGVTSGNPAGMEAVWKKVLGIDPYYSFVHKGVRFIVLNSNRGSSRTVPCPFSTDERGCEGSFDEPQLVWLEAQLLNPEPCILFIHHPLITDNNAQRSWSPGGTTMQVKADDRFYAVARANSARILGIFVGHGHLWESDTLNGTTPVHETASIGDYLGESDNIRTVSVDPVAGTMQTQQPGE